MNNDKKQHIIDSLKQGLRFDGRKLDEYRSIAVEVNVSSAAEGSARVKFGNTEVLAGVKLAIGEPYSDTPDAGVLTVNVELLPLSSNKFESGPPGIGAIELARVVDRGIRESKAIDLKKLCIKKGEKVWILAIDICPINADGNLFDAAALASMTALVDARFPKYENDEIDYKEKTNKKLPLSKVPISVTVGKIGEYFIIDPLPVEEDVFDARLTVASLEDDTLCALQKGGEHALTIDEISKMIDIALEKSKLLRKKLPR